MGFPIYIQLRFFFLIWTWWWWHYLAVKMGYDDVCLLKQQGIFKEALRALC